MTELVAGLIGAVIGGILTYCGAIKAARTQADHMLKNEKEMFELKDRKRSQNIFIGIVMELLDNKNIAEKTHHDTPIPFTADIWNVYKGDFLNYVEDKHLIFSFMEVHSSMKKVNGIIAKMISAAQDSRWNARYEQMNDDAKKQINEALAKLQQSSAMQGVELPSPMQDTIRALAEENQQ